MICLMFIKTGNGSSNENTQLCYANGCSRYGVLTTCQYWHHTRCAQFLSFPAGIITTSSDLSRKPASIALCINAIISKHYYHMKKFYFLDDHQEILIKRTGFRGVRICNTYADFDYALTWSGESIIRFKQRINNGAFWRRITRA